MSEIQGQPKVLSVGEEKALNQTIDDLKKMRDGAELNDMQGVNFEISDKASVQKKIDDLEKIRRNHSAQNYSSRDRQSIMAELNALTLELQEGMPTWTQYISSRPQHGPGHQKMVAWVLKTQADPIRQQKINRWKTLRRAAFPDDPQASNVMYLYPEG